MIDGFVVSVIIVLVVIKLFFGFMKRSELAFNLFSLPVDVLMLFLAGLVSFYIRFYSVDFIGPVVYQLTLGQLFQVGLFVIPVLVLIFALLGLYNLTGTRKLLREIGRVMLGVSVGLSIVMVMFFFDHTLFPSRFIILATWFLGILFVVLGRVILKFAQEFAFKHNVGLHKLVMVNSETAESRRIYKYLKNKELGYDVVAKINHSVDIIQKLEQLYLEKQFDEIMQTNTGLTDGENLAILEFARQKGIHFSFVPNLFEVQRTVVEFQEFKGVPVVNIKNTPLDGWGRVAKRLMDIVASLICLTLTAPFFVLIYIAIKLDSSGRVIYPALRGGRGRDFMFYKFRTMYSHLSVGKDFGGDEAEKVRQELWKKNDRGGETGPFLKIKDDPRVTRVGKFLRRTKLDEIPQFWNVLKGDMSMVGPRAHVLDEVDRYRNRYRRMFSIKPGIFGMSQIAQSNWPDLPFEEEIRLNTYYIENWSLWLDVKILAEQFYLLFFAKKPKADY